MLFIKEATPERRQKIADMIATQWMQKLRDDTVNEAKRLAAEWDVPKELVAVWIAEILQEGVAILRDWQAGEAEAVGATITNIAAALELSQPTNYRRKAKNANVFAEARTKSQATEGTVPVPIGQWKINITPITEWP